MPENPDWKQRDPMLLSFFLCFWIYTVYCNTERFLIKKASISLVAMITWNLFKYLFFYKKSICSCETTLSMIFLNNDKNKKNLVLLTSCNMFHYEHHEDCHWKLQAGLHTEEDDDFHHPHFFWLLYFSLINIRERLQFCILSLIRIMNYTFHDLFYLILFIYFLDETKRIS